MAAKKSVIETGVDKLVKIISQYKKISVKDAAKELGVSVSSVEEWADFLEEEGIISIQSQFATVYLVEKKIGKKEMIEKVKAVKGEKDAFMRRVESSINALERDHTEIKLIDSEFKEIKSLLEKNFLVLGKKLEKLEDYKKSHREIDERRKEMEDEYESRINEVEKRLKKEHIQYAQVMEKLDAELEKVHDEQAKIETLKGSGKQLRTSVSEINQMLDQIKKEMEKEDEQLDLDAERLKKSEEAAKRIKESVAESANELDDITKKVRESRKELEKMEKDFLKDVESIQKGDLKKIGPYKETKEVLEKFKGFFAQTKEIETLIHKAEREELEMRDHFQKLAKKVGAFSVVTSVPEIKKEMEGLASELREIETRKDLLASQLKKLRTVVRAVVK